MLSSAACEPCSSDEARKRATDTIWELAQGNKRYVQRRSTSGFLSDVRPGDHQSLVDLLVEDPLKPTFAKAIVLSCARSYAPVDWIFDTRPGELQVIRNIGNICKANDGVVGSCEFALASAMAKGVAPPLLVVLGNSRNDVIEEAVRELTCS